MRLGLGLGKRGKAFLCGASRLAITAFLFWSGFKGAPALAGVALPSGGQFVAGQGAINPAANGVIVNQSSSHGIVNWQNFSIGKGNTVQFNNGTGATLNRVTGGNLSQIDGLLKGTGSVYLINPQGIVVGAGGKVITGGSFVGSTRDVSNDAFTSGGALTFKGSSNGNVTNAGTITSANGDVVLVGKSVTNTGTIKAANGTAGLAAGDEVVLQPVNGDQRIAVSAGSGSVTNSGDVSAAAAELKAAGGNVYALAGNSGVVRATGSQTINGHVWLIANGDVSVKGAVAATNADGSGGAVTVRGANITVSGQVAASATAPGQSGGTVSVIATNTTQLSGTIKAEGGRGGHGGSVETSGAHVHVAASAQVSTLAPGGVTGTWLIDPPDFTIAASGGDISGATLSNELATTDITLASSDGTVNANGNGDIFVNDAVSWSSASHLTLNAARNIEVNAGISLANGTLNLNAAGNIFVNAGISLTGGALNLNAAYAIDVNSTIHVTGAGAVNLSANSFVAYGGTDSYGDNSSSFLPNILNLNFADGASIDFGAVNNGATLSINNTPYRLLYSYDDMFSNLSANYISAIGATGAFALATDIHGGTYEDSNFSLAPGGIFEGLGHVMDSATLNYGTSDHYFGFNDGLFNTNQGTIRDFAITNATVNGAASGGGGGILLGTLFGGLIANVHVTGIITSNDPVVGGLVGDIELEGEIYNAWTDVPMTRSSMAPSPYGVAAAGGLVGEVYTYPGPYGAVFIVNSHALGAVTGYGDVGGLVGANGGVPGDPINLAANSLGYAPLNYSPGEPNVGAALINDYAAGNVTYAGTGSAGDTRYASSNVGGLAGVSSTFLPITNSYATGNVGGGYNAGGLVGYLFEGGITNSHATGNVSGGFNSGGLVGSFAGSPEAIIAASYATGNVTGNGASGSGAGGLVGRALPVLGDYGYGDSSGQSLIEQSYALGSVSNADYAGGLVGYMTTGSVDTGNGFLAVIEGYAAGSVTGATAAGGLIGYYAAQPNLLYGASFPGLIVAQSLSIGAVRGSGSVGGAIGAVNITSELGSYWVQAVFDSDTAGTANGIGAVSIAGYIVANTVTGLHTAVLQNGTLPDILATPLSYDCLSIPCGAADWAAQSGAYPYLTTFFPNGVQAISGMAYGDGGATPLAAGTVSALADGKSLGQVSTGANGYYYFAAQPGAFASGSALLVSTANGARVDALTSGANVTGFDIWGNTLIAPTSLTTYSAAVGEDHSALLNAADGNNSQLTGAINSLASRGFVAGGDFAVNGSPGLSNGLYVKSAGSITVSDPLTLTGNNLMLDAAQALDINAPITVTGSAINLTAASSIEVNAGISLTGGALNLTAASAIDVNKTITVTGAGAVNLTAGYYGPSILNLNFADGASLDFGSTNYGATLTISNRPYTLLYSFDDMYANFSGSYVLSIFGASGAFAMATDIDGGTYYNSNFGLASGGIFEGLGHVMDHVTLDYGDYGPSSNYSGNTTGFLYNDGLFNSTSGTIRDFAITNATFNGDPNIIGLGYPNYGSAGILAGFMEGGLIANVHVTGTITSNDVIVGGLVGLIEYQANIYNAWTDVPITRASMSANDAVGYSALAAGGLVGAVGGYAELNDVNIVNSHALGAVTGYGDVGGLVGANGTGFHDPISYATSDGSDLGGATLANDYATGNVTYAGSAGDARYASSNVGGLAGVSSYVPGYGITNSYATGNVGGGYNTGGLFGFMYDSSISGSHATGNVSGGFNAGGLVGSTYGAGYLYGGQAKTVTNSYATGNVTGNGASGSSAGGLVGALVGEEHGGDPYSFIALSYALGSVSNADYAGGLIGSLIGGGTFNLEGGFAAGSVTGATAAGGLIGYYSDLIPSIYDTFYVLKSLSIGAVRGGGSVGGAIGAVNETNPSDVYGVQAVFDSDTAGTANGIGATLIAGYNDANTVTPLHTADLQNGTLPGLLGIAQVGCDVTCWTAQSGAFPYLTALFPNGVQAISGMASGSSVGLSIGGASQGQASTGANGYYYFALPAGTLSGPGSLSLLTDTSGALLTTLSGQTAGLDIAPDALTFVTPSTSYAASSYDANRATAQGWAGTPAYVAGLADTIITATGASFALDAPVTMSGGFTVNTTGAAPVTVTAPVSAASVKIVSGGAITLDSTVTASGSGDAVVLDAGTDFINDKGAAAIGLTGTGRWLVYSSAPGGDSFGGLDSANTAVWDNSGAAVTQAGNRYVFAEQPTVTVSAGPVSKTYGDTYTFTSADLSLSGLEAGVAGAYLGDTAASVFASLPTLSSLGAAATANVNAYDINLSGGAVTGGYALVLGSPGTLTVGQRALTITGDPLARLYGDANPATWTAAGDNLVNGDTIASVALVGSTATAASNVGSYGYSIDNAAFTHGLASNYAITYADGGLTVNARPITVTANAQTKTYGDANPALTFTTSSLGAGAAVLGSLGTGADDTTGIGSYAITAGSVTNANNPNYAITYAGADLTINARPITLTYTADAAQTVYGDMPSGLGGTVAVTSGSYAGSQSLADVVSGTAGFATAADGASNVGHYAINGAGLAVFNTNYAVTLDQAAGNATALNITARPITLTYTADAAQSVYGNMPTGPSGTVAVTSGSYAGSQSLADVVSGTAGFTTTADGTSNVGRYAITGSGLTAFNTDYAVTLDQAAGNATALSITARPITVTYTADAAQSVYGDTPSGLTGSYALTGGSFAGSQSLADVVSGTAGFATAADGTSNVGHYAVNGAGLTAFNTNYAVTLDQAAGNASALSITARPLTVTADSGQSIVYGDTVPVLTYTVGGSGLVNGDSLSGALVTSATSTSNVGSYGITQGSLAASTNYTITSYTGANLAVTARPITVTADSGQSMVYGDTVPALTYTVGGLVNGDSLSGALATSATATSNVGGYGITQGSLASGNYTITSYTGADLAVTARPITVTYTADAASSVYGDIIGSLTGRSAITSGSLVNGDSLGGAAGFATLADGTSAVGTYGITGSGLTASGNYSLTSAQAAGNASALTITARPITLTYTAFAASSVYGDTPSGLTGTIVLTSGSFAGGQSLSDVVSGPASFATTAEGTSNVGSYAINGSGLASINNNYNVTLGQAAGNATALTVTARPITVTADNGKSMVYGDTVPGLTYTVGGSGLVNGDSLSGALATNATSTSNVGGSYTISQGTLTDANNPNYDITSYTGANLTVTARPITVTYTADAASSVYGDTVGTLAGSYAITSGNLVNADSLSGAASFATTTNGTSNVGAYAISGSGLTAGGNYSLTSAQAAGNASALSIIARPITVTYTADAASSVYGDAIGPLTGSYAITSGNLVNGNSLSGTASFAARADGTSAVGSYGITGSGLTTSGNYNLTTAQAAGNATALSITARPITVTADALTKTYGDASPALSFTTSNLGFGAAVQGSLDTIAGNASGVGNYAITQGSVTNASNPNYAISYIGNTLTIARRPITVTADALARTYGDANPALTYVISSGNLVNGDVFSGTLATAANTTSNVGNYAIVQGTFAATPNYALTYVPGTLSVTARALTVTADDLSRIYGNANPAFTYTIGGAGLANGDTLTGALATAADTHANVGSYAIGQGTLAASANYALVYTPGALAITPAALTVQADDISAATLATAKATATYSGLMAGDDSSVVTGLQFGFFPITNDPRDYDIVPFGALTANYAISYLPGVLTLAAQPPSVFTAPIIIKGGLGTLPSLVVTTGGAASSFSNVATAAIGDSSDTVLFEASLPGKIGGFSQIVISGYSNATDDGDRLVAQ